jgi:hypothetical protein
MALPSTGAGQWAFAHGLPEVKAEAFAVAVRKIAATKFLFVRQPFVITVKYILICMLCGMPHTMNSTLDVHDTRPGSLE